MDFSHRLFIIGFDDVHHILHGILPSVFSLLDQPGIGAEVAGIDADIGRFDMKISVEIRPVPMFPFADRICECAYKTQGTGFKQGQTILIRYSLIKVNLVGNGLQRRIQTGVLKNTLEIR